MHFPKCYPWSNPSLECYVFHGEKISSIFKVILMLFNNFICLCLAVLGLQCFRGFFAGRGELGLLSVAVCRRLTAVASHFVEQGL